MSWARIAPDKHGLKERHKCAQVLRIPETTQTNTRRGDPCGFEKYENQILDRLDFNYWLTFVVVLDRAPRRSRHSLHLPGSVDRQWNSGQRQLRFPCPIVIRRAGKQ